MSVIEADGLTKIYRTYRKEQGIWGAIKGLAKRKYDETRAADNVSFRIDEGEFVGFLGPNGAGKTTVLKCSRVCCTLRRVGRACSGSYLRSARMR